MFSSSVSRRQDARDERTIGAVAAVGVGKGVPQAEGDLSDAAFQQAGGKLGRSAGRRRCVKNWGRP